MACLSTLPDEVLKLVMQRVSLKDRLASCCLVNKRLHAAAVAATQQLVLHDTHWRPGMEWLSQYGQQITNLHLSGSQETARMLTCPNLRDLVLSSADDCSSDLSVQLGPAADGQPGILQDCTKLTRLKLSCNVIDAPAGVEVDSLSGLVLLKELHVEPANSNTVVLSQRTLPSLTRLTHLCMALAAENLTQLGLLTNLEQLSLYEGDSNHTAIGPSSMPDLVFPASLTQLLLCCSVEAGVISLVPDTLESLEMGGAVEGATDGPGSLMACLSRLQQLTYLYLDLEDGMSWPPPGPAYSALTASSDLVYLQLINPPAGVWSYVFPEGHKLPQLDLFGTKALTLDQVFEIDASSAWGAADLRSLVSCCPNLFEFLEDPLHLLHGSHVSVLHKLTCLTNLSLMYGAGDLASCQVSMKGLAAVTQLQSLSVDLRGTDSMTVATLLPLTSLKALTSLRCDLGAGLNNAESEASLCYKQQASWDAAVWLQLLRRCAEADCLAQAQLAHQLAGPEATAVVAAVTVDQQRQFSAHRQLSASQSQRTTQQEDRLALFEEIAVQQDKVIAGLQSQLSAQQQVTAQQQQYMSQFRQGLRHVFENQHRQLSAQRHVVAGQGQQIAGLQGQLQAMQALVQELVQERSTREALQGVRK